MLHAVHLFWPGALDTLFIHKSKEYELQRLIGVIWNGAKKEILYGCAVARCVWFHVVQISNFQILNVSFFILERPTKRPIGSKFKVWQLGLVCTSSRGNWLKLGFATFQHSWNIIINWIEVEKQGHRWHHLPLTSASAASYCPTQGRSIGKPGVNYAIVA